MPFDASDLHWKPFKTLHARLEGIKLDPGSVDAPSLRLLLSEYSPWLGKGLRGFKPPSDASKQAVETETALKAGDEEVPVEPSLRAAALSVSKALNLDQVQSYILVHRWRTADAAAAAAAVDPLALQGGALAPDQLRAVALLYFQERLRLLKSIEDLLLVGEGWSGVGAFADEIEEALGGLLGGTPGLEEVTFQALKENLEGDGSGAAPGLSAALLEAPPGAGAGAISLVSAGAASGVVVPGMAATRAGRSAAAEDLAALERNVLLSVLALIYFHPRKQCTHERFLELARLCHARLFSVPLAPAAAAAGDSPSPSRLSVKLATLLLLEVLALDADKALQAVAAGEAVDEKVNAFLAPGVQRQLDAELSSWRPVPGDPHAALLLAWAALLTLAGRGDAAAAPAAAATAADALAALRDLSSPRGLAPAAVDMAGTIVLSTAATALTAFGLDPGAMSPQQTRAAVDALCNVFAHHPALCDAFWGDAASVTAQPVRHFLDALAGGYPAAALPLLRLLTALAGGSPGAAAAACIYFARSTELTWLHALPNPAIGADPRDPGGLATAAELDLPGAKGMTLCAGVAGAPVPFDPDSGLAGAWPVWAPGAALGSPAALAVRWSLPAEADARPWALLCRAFGALAAVRGGGADAPAALAELDAGLGFLAALCRGDPGATAVNMLRFEAPAPGPEGAAAGQDALALAFQTVAALAGAAGAPGAAPAMDPVAASALAHAFRLCGAFVPAAAGRVAAGLLPALGVTPLDASMAARAPGTPPDAPLLRSLLAAEGAAGRYPATLGALHLLAALLQAACPAPALATLVSFALQRVAPELGRWKYAAPAQRWHLAEACLAVARHALLAAPSGLAGEGEGGAIVAAAAAALRSESGLVGCLVPLLPPPAPALEAQSSAAGAQAAEQVEAAEKCCVAWLRLVPVLLPPGDEPDGGGAAPRLAPGAFLRAPADRAPPPAAVLLSFLAYPYFAARERALVVRALHCFVAAASAAAPDLPLLPMLPQEGAGVAPAAKAALAEALEPATAAACPALFGAAADVLAAAVTRHPSLVDALLFGSALEAPNGGKENRGANDGAAGGALAAAKPPAPGPSCLDALWAVLRGWKALLADCPFAVAKALQAVAALWQAGGPAYRALAALQRQPGFWEAVVGVVEAGAAEGGVPAPGDGEEGEAPAAWARLQAPCWRVAAEAAALQVLAAECFAWRAASPPAGGAGPATAAAEAIAAAAVPDCVAAFAGPGLLAATPALLRRYCLPLPSAALERDCRRVAAAAAAELLATAVQDPVLWPSLQAGPCLASALAAAAAPALAAAAALGEAAAAALAPGGEAALRARPALGAMAEGLLAQAEVPPRLAACADLGPGFTYDGALLARRVGAPLAQESRLLDSLQDWLAAASVGASLEAARGDAAAALDALAAIAEALPAKLGGGTPADVVAALGEVVEGVVAEAAEAQAAARPGGDGPDGAAGPAARLHLAEAASAAKVALMALRRRGKPASNAEAYGAAAASMDLAARWFESLSLVLAVQATDNGVEVDGDALAAVSGSLLAAALHAVGAVPGEDPGAAAAQAASAEAQQAQHAAARLIPAAVSLVAGGDAGGPAAAAAATSLAAALLERLLPLSSWLPVVTHHLHFGRAMGAALERLAGGGSDGGDAARSLDRLLLLALQVTQAPAGAALLVEQGVPAVLMAVSAWLQAPPPGGALLGPPAAAPPPGCPDYSNAYAATDGSHAPAHRLWCGVLGLAGLLAAAAPAAPAPAAAALQLAVGMDPRLLLAVEPPEGSAAQPVTLAMAQETRYALFLLAGVGREAGRWRLALPHALPALRRASAALLAFLADPPEGVVCAAVSEAEKAAAAAPPPAAAPLGGWFGAGPRPSAFQWELAEQLTACVQYALAFQLCVAPEVSEAEAAALGPEWPAPAALRSLCERAIEVIDPGCAGGAAASPAVRRALRGAVAVARGCSRLAAVAAPGEAARLARDADAAAGRAGAVLATYARGA